jgi:hypothetical protein
MRRRKLLVALAVVAATVVALWPRPTPTGRVTRLNFGLLNEGMSQAEVEAVLGPPTDEATFPVEEQILETYCGPGQQQIWQNDEGRITIYFQRDRVVYKRFGVVRRADQSYLDDLLWHVKRQWHRWFP